MTLDHYQTTFEPLLIGVGVAIALTLLLKETGPAVRRAALDQSTRHVEANTRA
jgi:hypothetical protein